MLCRRLYVVLCGGRDGLHVEGQHGYGLHGTPYRRYTIDRGRLIEQRFRCEVHERGILRILVHRGDPKRKRTVYHTQLEVRITAYAYLHRGIVQAGAVRIVMPHIHHARILIGPYGDRGFQHVVIAPAVRQIGHMEQDVEFGFRRNIPRCSLDGEARHDHAYGTVVVAVVPIGLIGFEWHPLLDVFYLICSHCHGTIHIEPHLRCSRFIRCPDRVIRIIHTQYSGHLSAIYHVGFERLIYDILIDCQIKCMCLFFT